MTEWDEFKSETFRKLAKAAKRVSRKLPTQLRVRVNFEGQRRPLSDLLKKEVGGRLSEAVNQLHQTEHLSLSALANGCREGEERLSEDFGIGASQAKRIASKGNRLAMLIEEVELPHTTSIELNIGPPKQPPEWRELDDLSTGQKATALLLLLLLEADAPLVVDQPENDLDNRFITGGIVPRIRDEKRRRQFLFATHNANIPVLGDAELMVGLNAVGGSGDGYIEIRKEHLGSIDSPDVAEMVKETLEGGKPAFTMRHLKYGF